jgi:hypothetical protein
MINSRKRSRAESDKGEETYIDLPQQFITRTGITYYKVGNIVSLTRGEYSKPDGGYPSDGKDS